MSAHLRTGPTSKSPIERIEERTIPCPATGCLLWTARISGDGYGRIGFKGKNWRAHRLMWTLVNGPIPDSMKVCHKCDVPSCVNPDHLFLGTHLENMADMRAKGRNRKSSGPPRPRNKGVGRIVKLNPEKVRYILRDHRPNQALAKELGVSPRLVGQVRKREIWRHVEASHGG